MIYLYIIIVTVIKDCLRFWISDTTVWHVLSIPFYLKAASQLSDVIWFCSSSFVFVHNLTVLLFCESTNNSHPRNIV